MRRPLGFTLIEIMVTVVLTGLVVSVVVGLYARMSRTYDALNMVGDAQQNLRAVRSMLAREIRASGGNPMGVLMAGGRIWFPPGAQCHDALGAAPELGCEFWLGFNFQNNWVDPGSGTDTLSDLIFVSYATHPQKLEGSGATEGVFAPVLLDTLDDAAEGFDGATLPGGATLPAELEIGDFAMLTNGYHACVVEIRDFSPGPPARVEWTAGGGSNPGNGLKDYCLPFQTSGPGAGTNTGVIAAGGTYCKTAASGKGLGAGPPDRQCYLLDMQTIRLRRFYIWPVTTGAGDRELRLETANGAERLSGGGADLLGPGVTREVLVRGMEDMQVSYSLREDNGTTPGKTYPDPPLIRPGETEYQAAADEFEYHVSLSGLCLEKCAASCLADTADCRGECVPGDGDCPANPNSPQDEARWLDQVTVTLLVRTRSRLPGALGGKAGFEELNSAWGSAQPAQASSYLRRSLRVEVDMRNYARPW
jgi:prepilin-type N-terminal cleavage/methylation domain-containing protein